MTLSKAKKRPARKRPQRRKHRSPLVWMSVVIAFLFLVALVLTLGGDNTDTRQTGNVRITGDALPPMARPDSATGLVAPSVEGVGFDGAAVSLMKSGRPTAVVFLAHWCSHCQQEVRDVVSWLKTNSFASTADIVGVVTMTDSAKPNYPPSAWLDREGWPFPSLLDDGDSRVAEAYGLVGTPLWVFVGSDGRVTGRLEGEVPPEQLAQVIAGLR